MRWGLFPKLRIAAGILLVGVSGAGVREGQVVFQLAHILTPLSNDHRETRSRAAKAKPLNEWKIIELNWSVTSQRWRSRAPLFMRGEVEFTPTDKDQPCKLNVSMHTLCYYPMAPESATI